MSLFAGLPPEITSARMYSGPGSGSMLAAAAAWNAISAEMRSAATNYGSVITALASEGWLGPSSTRMSAAIAPYLEWLSTTAVQAEQTGAQANAAAAAYEAAFAATVPPPVVAANRTQLANLVASNIFGQNAGAIAATEAQYGEMWAQDASAMTSYTTASRAATQMTPFSQPQSDTATVGTAQQSNAVLNATNYAAAAATSSSSSIFAPGSGSSTTGLAGLLNTLSNSNENLLGAFLNNNSVPNLSNGFTTNGILNPTTFVDSMMPVNGLGATGATTEGLQDLAAGLGDAGLLSSVSVPGAAAMAGVGQASLVGAVSVPPAWSAAGAAIAPVAATTQVGAGAYQALAPPPRW